MIRLTIDDLKKLVERMENRETYGNMCGTAYVTIERYPNGREYLQFEQPCQYTDCNSEFYKFDGMKMN